jgi:uncharacterized protein with HEPN domain
LPDELKDRAPEIRWSAIAAIGNILRHEYQRVEAPLVWNIVEQHLSSLRTVIDEFVADSDRSERDPP